MIWVIAGTQDGREIALRLHEERKEPILVTVVSDYGQQLASHAGLEVRVGRFNQSQMEALIREKEITLLVDASHPYAAVVSETARAAAANTDISYIRYERPEVALPEYDNLYHTANEQDAAELAGRLGERIFLTTGSKTLAVFAKAPALQGKQVWTRVLPSTEVMQSCLELGYSPKYIIAMQGPFTYDLNKAMYEATKAEVVVMKNSGLIGGSDTKLAAAIDCGLTVVVIDRPVSRGSWKQAANYEEIIQLIGG